MKFILCYVIFIAFIFTEVISHKSGTTSNGQCPAPSLTQEQCATIRFRFMCNNDMNCEAGQKCCNNGCVGVCTTPIQATGSRTTISPAITRKPGQCPAPQLKPEDCIATTFQFMCNVDSDCKGVKKCCSNGCAGACVTPSTTTSTASCPAPTLTQEQCKFVKFASCVNNAACTGNRICCNNGCGKACMEPAIKSAPTCTAKAGFCSKQNVNCIWSQCKSDCDCPGNQKCCHGCLCTPPISRA